MAQQPSPTTGAAPSPDMSIFLTNMKLIYEHGFAHSRNRSRMHLLFAIHNCHYAVEQILREKAKDITFNDALHKIGFERIIKVLNDNQTIPDYNHLLELNKIRNSAEHSNIIPDVDAVRFHVKISGDFLKWSYLIYFNVDYESLALENMIFDYGIKECMIKAKQSIEADDLATASAKLYEALAAFKFLAFGYLSDPRVNGISFGGIDFPNLLADLALKVIMAEDENALGKMMLIGSSFKVQDGKIVGVESKYPIPVFKNKDEANEHYEDIMSIILTYQGRLPHSVWRSK
jgi:hypothetical protein